MSASLDQSQKDNKDLSKQDAMVNNNNNKEEEDPVSDEEAKKEVMKKLLKKKIAARRQQSKVNEVSKDVAEKMELNSKPSVDDKEVKKTN